LIIPRLANLARNSFVNEPLMSAIAHESIKQMSFFKPAELAMLTWSYAVAGIQAKPLMDEIGTEVVSRHVSKFSAQQLSHIAWAFGALSLKHIAFLQQLSTHVQTNTASIKAQSLSNIAWAFAMVAFRDESLLRKAAPEIARGVSELRPLALARCAWAYWVLGVHCPEVMSALAKEACGKIDDFPTKALCKLVDSVYVSPLVPERVGLEDALVTRMQDISAFLMSTWVSGESLSSIDKEEYCANLLRFGVVDFGIVGTPLLLSQLEIKLPSIRFIRLCRSRAWTQVSQQENNEDKDRNKQGNAEKDPQVNGEERPSKPPVSFTAAEIDVAAGDDKRLKDWVVRHIDEAAEDQYCQRAEAQESEERSARVQIDKGLQEDAGQYLVVVDLPGRVPGRSETFCRVLSSLCMLIFGVGVEPGSAEARATVKGSVQLISTFVPCVACIGALLQFRLLFPNVVLEFAEQAGATSD
jgi:hypothetical protein